MQTHLDVLLVCEKGLDELLGVVRSEVGGLVPTDGVVVDVNLAQAAHHLQLVVRARVLVRVLVRGGVGGVGGEGKAVGHLEGGADVEAEGWPVTSEGDCSVQCFTIFITT